MCSLSSLTFIDLTSSHGLVAALSGLKNSSLYAARVCLPFPERVHNLNLNATFIYANKPFCDADMRSDVQAVFKLTPHEKQVMMFSATLSNEIRPICKKFMTDVGPPIMQQPATRPTPPKLLPYSHLRVIQSSQTMSELLSCHKMASGPPLQSPTTFVSAA